MCDVDKKTKKENNKTFIMQKAQYLSPLCRGFIMKARKDIQCTRKVLFLYFYLEFVCLLDSFCGYSFKKISLKKVWLAEVSWI
jgi:hypothetical protein